MSAEASKRPAGQKNDVDIAAAGKATQFGAPGGPDPVEAAKASVVARVDNISVRNELRYLVSQPISNETGEVEGELKRLRQTADGRTTVGRMLASRLLERAIKKADPHLASTLLDNMEGKLSQEIVIPPTSKGSGKAITIEEAEEMYKKHMPN